MANFAKGSGSRAGTGQGFQTSSLDKFCNLAFKMAAKLEPQLKQLFTLVL